MTRGIVAPLMLLAEGPGGAAGGGGGFGGLGSMLPALIFSIFLFYLLLIRPQRRQEQQRKQMLADIKKNDHVVTVGGIYGVVTNIKTEADEVTLRVDEATNTKISFTLSSIVRVVRDEPKEEKAAN